MSLKRAEINSIEPRAHDGHRKKNYAKPLLKGIRKRLSNQTAQTLNHVSWVYRQMTYLSMEYMVYWIESIFKGKL